MSDNNQDEPSVIAAFRKIVSEWQYNTIDGTTIDATTASIVCQVYDKLSENNRAKLATFSASKIAEVCVAVAFRMVK